MCLGWCNRAFTLIQHVLVLCRNFTFHQVNAEGARRIARAAKEMGVSKLIHMSHISASPKPRPIYLKGGSNFLKSKVKPIITQMGAAAEGG